MTPRIRQHFLPHREHIIVGAGLLGRALASRLSAHGCIVRLQGRYDGAVLASRGGAPKIVWITTKAYDLWTAVEAWIPVLSGGSDVVTLCNGCVWPLAASLQSECVRKGVDVGIFPGMTTMAVAEGNGGGYRLVHSGSVCMGASDDEDHLAVLKRKWIFNVVANSLCAVHCLARNGLLTTVSSQADQGLAEAYRLAGHLWGSVPWTLPEVMSAFWQLVRATQWNENSMARDVRLGRKTENEFLAGQSRGVSLDLPYLKAWAATLDIS